MPKLARPRHGPRFRSAVGLIRGGCLASVMAFAAAAFASSGVARAAYPGRNGALAYESFSSENTNGGPPNMEFDTVQTGSRTIASCTNSAGLLACDFGAPSYSPNGSAIVVSRLIPSNAFEGRGRSGALMLVAANGSRATGLAAQTADDEDPAFLPSGLKVVFDGRPSATAARNLYEVSTNGTGLRKLTHTGGSNPAPCANGKIAFVKHGNIYLLAAKAGSAKQITFRGGSEPSCSPNSKQIAFARGCQLYTIGSNGNALHLVSSPCAQSLSFSPNGRDIAFITPVDEPSSNGGAYDLEVVNLNGHHIGSPTQVASYGFDGDSGTQSDGHSAGFSWQPMIG